MTLRAIHQLPSFRDRALFRILRESIRAASRSPAVGNAFRIVHFSVQRDHVHVIVEAASKSVLTRGVQGLAIRLARATSRAFGLRGSVWADRYHARALKTPREVRNAIVYVLMNAKKHGCALPRGIDPCSSAPWTDAIRGNHPLADPPVMAPRTWLAGIGWRRRGRIAPEEKPT